MSDERSAADEEIMRLAVGDDEGGEDKADTLELGGDEAPKVEDKADEHEDADEHDEEKKTRSRPWSKRVDILTARLREAESRAAQAEARLAGGDKAEDKEPDPSDGKYEFGEADPAYLKDLARFEARQLIADERKEAAAQAEQQAFVGKLNEGMASVEKAGTEKYEDFEAKISEAVEARGGEPLPPLLSIGIAVSPAGADIAYKLASDPDASEHIEALAKIDPKKAALAFGEIEGEFVDSDTDLNLDDPLDMARMLGRMQARLKGKGKSEPAKVVTTKAPKPPEHTSRGASGKFEVDDDTEDFAAFEKKVMGRRG
jgi:hypothetical protein